MSRTYRDVTRGRYRAADKKFDNDPNNKEKYWYRCYRYERGTDRSFKSLLEKTLERKRVEEWHYGERTKIELQHKTPWHLLTHKQQMHVWAMSTPSWWVRLNETKPKRREERDKLRKYIGTRIIELDEECEFPLARKSHEYYW